MYEAYFGLKEKPFTLLPDPTFLFLGRTHQESLTMLEYGLANQAGFTVLTGEIGSGKTTLVRHLLNQLGSDVRVGLITNTHASLGSLMQWVLASFDLSYEPNEPLTLYNRFVDFLVTEYQSARRVVLIVDEAQNMGREMLEELRMLSNINADKHLVLQIVLVGQPELLEILRDPRLRQFAQRISVNYHLDALDANDTNRYVRYRLNIAGATRSIFSDDALEVVFEVSRGIPRLINLVCDAALVYAFGAQSSEVGAALIEEVVDDKVRTGLGLGGEIPALPRSQPLRAQPPAVSVDEVLPDPVDAIAPWDPTVPDASADDIESDAGRARELFANLRRS
ncbi:MAG: AAA family ATPase, partial [Gammaproteobacteria bacterium]|nr:AAA family ATPase [Gammaproteobacteria bacterium]